MFKKIFSFSKFFALIIWVLLVVYLPGYLEKQQLLPPGVRFIPYCVLSVAFFTIFVNRISFRLGILFVIFFSLFSLFKPPLVSTFLDGIHFRVQDAFFKLRGPIENSRQVVIADIDNTSLKELGQWPWPRTQLARFVRNVLEDDARVVGFDIVFPEKDRMSMKDWFRRMHLMGMEMTLPYANQEESQKAIEKNDWNSLIKRKNIKKIIIDEWIRRLKEEDPDFELSEQLSLEEKERRLEAKYLEVMQALWKDRHPEKKYQAPRLPLIEMMQRSRELFFIHNSQSDKAHIPQEAPVILDNDQALGEVFQDARVVAGGFLTMSVSSGAQDLKKMQKKASRESSQMMVLNSPILGVEQMFPKLKKATGQVLNVPSIQENVVQQGTFNIVPDPSGAARYYSHLLQAPIFLESLVLKSAKSGEKEPDPFNPDNYESQIISQFLTYPSLALTMLRVANDYDVGQAFSSQGQNGILLKREKGFDNDLMGKTKPMDLKVFPKLLDKKRFIPLDFKGDLLINFLGEGGKWEPHSRYPKRYYFPYISISDVIQKRFPKGFFKNKYVLVGSTDPTLHDLVGSPYRAAFPGLEVHATMLENLIQENFLMEYGEMTLVYTFFGILYIGALLVFIWSFSSVWFASLVMLLTLGGLPFWSYWVFVQDNMVAEIVYPWISLAGISLVVMLLNYFIEGRERRFVAEQFSSMVSPDVLKKLQDDPKGVSLGGRKAVISVFFSDLAGFTSISEGVTPQELVKILNDYFTPMTNIILDYDGFIDKFMGDAIMACWGVPFEDSKHAIKACHAALDQQEKLLEIAAKIKKNHNVDIYARMGIASGEVSAAMTGSETRKSYTVLGDVVNLGARLEPACKDYGILILIAENTYLLAKDHIEARCIDKIVVKGKTVPVPVYELMAKKGELPPEKMQLIKLFNQALELHWERKWEEALSCIQEIYRLFPEDSPTKNLEGRIHSYQKDPPEEGWQGEIVKKTNVKKTK